jgi:hypothetical protein
MADEKTIAQKFIRKLPYAASYTGTVGDTDYKVWGENKLRVIAPIDGSGQLIIKARLSGSTTYINIGELNSSVNNKTFDISTYDYIKFDMAVGPSSAGEVAASGFFSKASGVSVTADTGTLEEVETIDIIGGTDIDTEVVGNSIIINSTAAAGAGLEAYTHDFIAGDWQLVGEEYHISVLQVVHGLGTEVDLFVYELDTDYKEIELQKVIDGLGNITIKINRLPDNRFDGRIHIKES